MEIMRSKQSIFTFLLMVLSFIRADDYVFMKPNGIGVKFSFRNKNALYYVNKYMKEDCNMTQSPATTQVTECRFVTTVLTSCRQDGSYRMFTAVDTSKSNCQNNELQKTGTCANKVMETYNCSYWPFSDPFMVGFWCIVLGFVILTIIVIRRRPNTNGYTVMSNVNNV